MLDDDVMKAIGRRIADRREYLRLSQLGVADKMGKQRPAVSHWETGATCIFHHKMITDSD
ncbi:MAG: helix-turn-helix domain-containing protein [Capsulimonadaceae bacterium]